MNTGILPVYFVRRPSVSEKDASVAPKQIMTKPTRWIPNEQVMKALRKDKGLLVRNPSPLFGARLVKEYCAFLFRSVIPNLIGYVIFLP